MKLACFANENLNYSTDDQGGIFVRRSHLAEVFRMTNHLMTLGLGGDVGEKAMLTRRWAERVKLHPFDTTYGTELDQSLQDLGKLLIDIGYLVPIEPRNASDSVEIDTKRTSQPRPVSMLKDSTNQKVRRPCYGERGDRALGS
jgi:hypothetical protein